MPLFKTLHCLDDHKTIESQSYGVIEVVAGELVRLRFRPWPKMISMAEAQWAGGWGKKQNRKNQVKLYYNQPIGHRNFLALKYIVSTIGTRWKTVSAAMSLLDQVAQIKKTDAIVCELSNQRISDRLMERLGYVRHLEHSRKRHWIKRFYGEYETPLKSQQLATQSKG